MKIKLIYYNDGRHNPYIARHPTMNHIFSTGDSVEDAIAHFKFDYPNYSKMIDFENCEVEER